MKKKIIVSSLIVVGITGYLFLSFKDMKNQDIYCQDKYGSYARGSEIPPGKSSGMRYIYCTCMLNEQNIYGLSYKNHKCESWLEICKETYPNSIQAQVNIQDEKVFCSDSNNITEYINWDIEGHIFKFDVRRIGLLQSLFYPTKE